jgi:hypothetical protein
VRFINQAYCTSPVDWRNIRLFLAQLSSGQSICLTSKGDSRMAQNETRRLKPTQIQLDIESYDALLDMTDYAPVNPAYSVANVTASRTGMSTSQQEETQAVAAAAAKRDNAVSNEWAFHNIVLGVKDQVVALFGKNSNQAQAIGLKKKSEYKTRSKSPKTPPTK